MYRLKGFRVRVPPYLLLAWLLLLPVLTACGSTQTWTVEGRLVAGDTDVWLIDTTPVAIGAAKITGESPIVGARVRASGRRDNGELLQATSIVVGPPESSAPSSALPPTTVRGRVEAGDRATGRWTIAGTPVRVPPGTGGATQLATGRTVTIQGYALPDSGVLASIITVNVPPTAAPTPTAPAPPAPAPAAPARTVPAPTPTAPAQPAPKKPAKKNGDGDSKPDSDGSDD